jgi:hypothetical protein
MTPGQFLGTFFSWAVLGVTLFEAMLAKANNVIPMLGYPGVAVSVAFSLLAIASKK